MTKTPRVTEVARPKGREGTGLERLLEGQRAAYGAEGPPSAEVRIDRIDRAIDMVARAEGALVEALGSDFGHRSPHTSRLADVAATLNALVYARSNLKEWMKPERRKVGGSFKLLGMGARIEYEPLGVVGIIGPWNFPVVLSLGPMAEALAAGNRVMIKPSELVAATSEVLADIVGRAFDPTEVAVVTGGPDVAGAFAALPLDHLMFTGSPRVGRLVMRAAADNLTPVTLELGGKSPVYVSPTFDLALAARRIMAAKTTNAGQVCMAPDLVYVPRGQASSFVEHAKAAVARMFPTLRDNPDYTSVFGGGHLDRLQGMLDDARQRGARIVEANPAGEDLSSQRDYKIPPTFILDATDEMEVLQEEIFGPLLPVLEHDGAQDFADAASRRPKALCLYYFGTDGAEEAEVLRRVPSGTVTVNNAMTQYNVPDLPFGGVGESGMGAYRGVHGFRTFSNAKGVCSYTHRNVPDPLEPPFGRKMEALIKLWGRH